MKYAMYVTKRYVLTAVCKIAAVVASKIHTTWTFEFLDKSLLKRDETLIRESKFCMLKTIAWQEKAKRCIIAHHEYEKEMKKNQKPEKKEA